MRSHSHATIIRARHADLDALEAPGIKAAVRIATGILKASIGVTDPGRLQTIIHTHALTMEPVILDGMVAAHLRGRFRAMLETASHPHAKRGLHLGPYDDATEYYRKRLALTDDQVERIRHVYGNEAVRVTRSASEVLEGKASQAIQESLEAGEHVKDATARLQAAFEASGVVPQNSFLMETLFRTQTAIAYSAGTANFYARPEMQEIITGYRYYATMDGRVRPSHASWNGFEGPKDHQFFEDHFPPCGWGCRCSILRLFTPYEPENNSPDTWEPPDEDPNMEWGLDLAGAFPDGL